MDSHPDNPASNKLPTSIDEEGLSRAIRASGYPLQSRIAKWLRERHYLLQEEWSYIDRVSGTTRSLDILARHHHEASSPALRVQVALLIECKRSDLPYVFFLTEGHARPDLVIAGLRGPSLLVQSEADPKQIGPIALSHALGLRDMPFMGRPNECTTFARVEASGSKLHLSGANPYNSLVHPLVGATRHFRAQVYPHPQTPISDAYLVIPIALLDAPMVGLGYSTEEKETLIPWVRLLRHDLESDTPSFGSTDSGTLRAIDFVHVDFLEQYLDEHLIPFFNTVAALLFKHRTVLEAGRAIVDELETSDFLFGFEKKLRPHQS